MNRDARPVVGRLESGLAEHEESRLRGVRGWNGLSGWNCPVHVKTGKEPEDPDNGGANRMGAESVNQPVPERRIVQYELAYSLKRPQAEEERKNQYSGWS